MFSNNRFKVVSCNGFSLIEMLVVVSIIFILSAIGLHYFRSDKYTLNSFVETLVGNMNRARLMAVANNKTVYVDFGKGSNRYVVWIDEDGDGVFSSSKDKIIADVQNNKITFSDLPSKKRFSFNSLGWAKNRSVLVNILSCANCATDNVTVSIMGRIRVEQQ